MHYHAEIVMPPVDDIEKAIAEILKPFSVHDDENGNTFWDWYVVGGRFSGCKRLATFDKDTLDKFNAEIAVRKVTVSGVQCGKQSLSPASQIQMVDALWHEMFPDAPDGPCPLFDHAGPSLEGDVVPFANVPDTLPAHRIIFARGPSEYHDDHQATFMLADEHWNGVNFEKTPWDGTFAAAVAALTEHFAGHNAEYREHVMPTSEWVVVTVDYHS